MIELSSSVGKVTLKKISYYLLILVAEVSVKMVANTKPIRETLVEVSVGGIQLSQMTMSAF